MGKFDKPRRLANAEAAVDLLREHLPAMAEMFERERHMTPAEGGSGEGRKVRECAVVMICEESDGTQSVVVLGDSDQTHLEIKGILHDGIYAIAHADEMRAV